MSPISRALFTTASDEWGTPQALFKALNAEFNFSLDACASPANAKVSTYFTRADDGLAKPWSGAVFVNPPYGRQVTLWLAKAYRESRNGATVVCLIAARTDTVHWHRSVMRASEVRFIRGRLRFEPAGPDQAARDHAATGNSAPFPSCVVVFRPGWDGPPIVSSIGRDGTVLAVVSETSLQGHD